MDDKEKEKAIKTLRKNVAYIEKMQPDSHGVVIAIPLHGSPDEIEGKVGKISAELKASVESFLPAGSADPEDENAKFKIYLHKKSRILIDKETAETRSIPEVITASIKHKNSIAAGANEVAVLQSMITALTAAGIKVGNGGQHTAAGR